MKLLMVIILFAVCGTTYHHISITVPVVYAQVDVGGGGAAPPPLPPPPKPGGVNDTGGNTSPTTNTGTGPNPSPPTDTGAGPNPSPANNPPSFLLNPLNAQFQTIPGLLTGILQAVVLIAFPIIVFFLVFAAFKFVTAQGNPQKIAEAKKMFMWTLIGALLVLGAQALSLAIEATVESLK